MDTGRNGFDAHEEMLLENAMGDGPPPVIGGDERRMHVRAYNHWVSLLAGRPWPSIADIDPAGHEDFAAHAVLLDFTGGAEDPAIAWLGRKLRDEAGADQSVSRIADVPRRSLLSRLTDQWQQILLTRAPVGFEAEFTNHQGLMTLYRGILMPFSSNGETIDFVYGVINWKHVAADALTEALSRDLNAALRLASPSLATAPVWADGPHAGLDALVDDEDEPEPGAPLADWLAAARNGADAAREAEVRARTTLHAALGRAYDLVLAAEAQPADWTALIGEEGLAPDAGPVRHALQLVFGPGAPRLAEHATTLARARAEDVAVGGMPAWLEGKKG